MSVKFKEFEHIISEQFRAENAFLTEYQSGNYTFKSPYVKLNPYLIAPLRHLLCLRQQNQWQ